MIRARRTHNRQNNLHTFTLAQQISKPLKQDIYSLKCPKIIKKSLKTLKAILGLFSTVKKKR